MVALVAFTPFLLSPSSLLLPDPASSLLIFHRACATSDSARGPSVAARRKQLINCGASCPRRCCGAPPLLRRAAPLRRPQPQGAQAPGSQTSVVASHCAQTR